jgi:hypothetical protein
MAELRYEIVHNTREQVREYVADGLAILGELELERGEHAALLVKVVELLASKTVQVQNPQPIAVLPGMLGLGQNGPGSR